MIPASYALSFYFLLFYVAFGAAVGIVVSTCSIVVMTPTLRSLITDASLGGLGYVLGLELCWLTDCADVRALAVPLAALLPTLHEAVRWRRTPNGGR